jgi:hypothetical protein
MIGPCRVLLFLMTLLVNGITLAYGEEPPAETPPAEDDIQSRGIIGAPRQIPGTVQFAFRITGPGQLTVTIGSDIFTCTSTCSRPLRAGTPIQLTAAATFPTYRLKEWQNCTGRITGTTCQMAVPANTLAAGVGVLFTSSALEDMAAQREQWCRQYPDLCDTCRLNPTTPHCQGIPFPNPPR